MEREKEIFVLKIVNLKKVKISVLGAMKYL